MQKWLDGLIVFLKSGKSKVFAGGVLVLLAEFLLGNLPRELLYSQVLQLVFLWLGLGAGHGLAQRAYKYFLK